MSETFLFPEEACSEKEQASLFSPSSFSPNFLELLAKKGFSDPETVEAFLDAGLHRLRDPKAMKGMDRVIERLERARDQKEKILIHGDYDVDGITGAAVVAKTLEIFGIAYTAFLPNRVRDGYGVSSRAIQEAAAQGTKLLITVDCGITAREQITLANSLGVETIVIDHHQIPSGGIPPAYAILNPHQEDCSYGFDGLSAAGLAFKLAQALIGSRAYELLDLAALSTVCDVAPLVDENRIIVKEGLKKIQQKNNPGMQALYEVSRIRGELNTGHIGFMLGPRINAAGRMSSPEIALRLFLTSSLKEASSLAQILEEENKSRQLEERQMVKEAIAVVERTFHFNRDRVIVVGKQGWHQGVIGIVAARLVDKYHRPAIVIAFDGEKGKGSCRSTKNFNIHEALSACAGDLMEFGGHAQAAGLSIQETKLDAFRKSINEFALTKDPKSFEREIPVDLELTLDDLSGRFIQELELLEPHGAGNPRPVFRTRGLSVKPKREWLYQTTLKFWVEQNGAVYEVHWSDRMNGVDERALTQSSKIDLIYSVKSKTWAGIETLILEAKSLCPSE
ncbi:MAG: single-stranded-DNA-specific exonuclease RecJ [Candidatus Omnitrophica bacterium]|nr:single-stranded-DNA-specific exonuclease RecJ [Candidatus Omnitrophota bacterium]